MKAWVALQVEDLNETVQFYGAAFGFAAIAPQGDADRVTLAVDGSELRFVEARAVGRLLLDDVEAPPAGLPQGSEVVLVVENVRLAEVWSRALRAGALPVRPPSSDENGPQEAFLRDPNGFLIRLCQEHQLQGPLLPDLSI